MRSGARSGSDGSTSVEAGRQVGTSVKSRLKHTWPPISKPSPHGALPESPGFKSVKSTSYLGTHIAAGSCVSSSPGCEFRDMQSAMCMYFPFLQVIKTLNSDNRRIHLPSRPDLPRTLPSQVMFRWSCQATQEPHQCNDGSIQASRA